MLGIQEGTWEDTWLSLEGVNRIDFIGGLRGVGLRGSGEEGRQG